MVARGLGRLTAASSHGFAHLHVRSGFSYGYGTATPEELAGAAARMGMGALALTDRDGLYGIPRLLKAVEGTGVSPIVGAEVSVAEPGGGHVVLLAEGNKGYRSLCRLLTSYRCSSEDRRKPLCPLSALAGHGDGLICLTGAVPFGLLPRLILAGRVEEAKKVLGLLREAFGPGNVFVELADDRTAGGGRRLGRVARFAAGHGVPALATNEVAYLAPRDHRLHEVLVASSNLTRLPGPGYRETDQLWLKPPAKMARLFRDYPEALANAAAVAERCAGSVRLAGRVHVPAIRLPGGETSEGRLVRLAKEGAQRRYGQGLDRKVRLRLGRELSCIRGLGFSSYFLLAREAVGIAKQWGVPVTGRGSAANSLVAYCLGLTQVEPFDNRLLFERFLHEERRDPPDIDLDFCSEGRDGVRRELIQRYSERCGVAEAATSQTFSLRGAVRAAARALGHSPSETDALSRHVPTRFTDRDRLLNPVRGWEDALSEPAMRGHPLQDREGHGLLLELSWGLAGKIHQAGTHSGGLVFGTENVHLAGIVPLEPSGTPGLLRCQADKDDLEYLGLPKLDLLGLKMHTALRKAGALVSGRLGRKVDPLTPPPGDAETYALIRTGRNVGMFQLESPGQMHLSGRLLPSKFPDLVAQISLFRPGPVRGDFVTPYVKRRRGLEPYSVPLPELEKVLESTYGVLIFQEQVLEVARAVAGFSLVEGDRIRRAMTKNRGHGAMDGIREVFLKRAVRRGVPEETAEEVFDWMEGFSVYGFPRAHAASFAAVSYASAYMRTHYPAEFFCGLLNSQPMGFYSPRVLLNEARRIGIEVLPPDVHLSGQDFTVGADGGALRVGLGYCKGLSGASVSSVVSEREKRPFSSVADLYRRTTVERASLRNLIEAGFLDDLDVNANRSRLLDLARKLPDKRRRHDRQPEIPLTHPASWWEAREDRKVEHLPPTETRKERAEWEVLGLNVGRHPLRPYRDALKELKVVPSGGIRRLRHGTRARAAGLMECLQCPPTKSGHPVWFLLIEDEWGLLQATIFRRVYERYGELLHHRGAFLLEGRIEQGPDKGFAFLVQSVWDLRDALAGAKVPAPRAVSGAGALLRAGRRAG